MCIDGDNSERLAYFTDLHQQSGRRVKDGAGG